MLEAIFGECLNYKSGLRILIGALEVPFFGSQRWALLAKVPVFGPKKSLSESSVILRKTMSPQPSFSKSPDLRRIVQKPG